MCLPVSKAVNANVMDLRVISRFSWAIAQGRRAASTPFGVCYTLPILCAVGVTVHVPNYWKGGGGFLKTLRGSLPKTFGNIIKGRLLVRFSPFIGHARP